MGPKKNNHSSKPPRRFLTIEEKKEIVSAHEKGVRIVELSILYGVPSSSISTILKRKEEVKAASFATGVKTLISHYQRGHYYEEMEKLLLIWVNQVQISGVSLTRDMICTKAKTIFADLKQSKPGTSSDSDEETFKASRGWFENFKKRTNIKYGEDTTKEEAVKFSFEFQEWMIHDEYEPKQVFYCRQTQLFWKRMPDRTSLTTEEKSKPGHKPRKDSLTLVLCANASGDLRIKPMLVYHSDTPRIFKKHHVCKPLLTVYWKTHPKTLVSRRLFTEWVLEVFGPTVKSYLDKENLPSKAVLLLDPYPGHPPNLDEILEEEFDFVTVKFLPACTTPTIQPLNSYVIGTFKKLYTKLMFQTCFEGVLSTSVSLREFWRDHYHILHAIEIIVTAWESLSVETLNESWRKLWPSCCGRSVPESEEPAIVDSILSLSDALQLEVCESDIEELVKDRIREISTEELEDLKALTEDVVVKPVKETPQDNNLKQEIKQEENTKIEIPTEDLKNMIHHWEEFRSLATKWHTGKPDVNKLLATVENKCVYQFRKMFRKRVLSTSSTSENDPPQKKLKEETPAESEIFNTVDKSIVKEETLEESDVFMSEPQLPKEAKESQLETLMEIKEEILSDSNDEGS